MPLACFAAEFAFLLPLVFLPAGAVAFDAPAGPAGPAAAAATGGAGGAARGAVTFPAPAAAGGAGGATGGADAAAGGTGGAAIVVFSPSAAMQKVRWENRKTILGFVHLGQAFRKAGALSNTPARPATPAAVAPV